jgi:hypothetical protein
MCQVTEGGPAILFLDCDTEQAKLAEFRPEVTGKFVICIDIRGARCNPVSRERRDGLAQQVEILAEPEIEIEHLYYPQAKSMTWRLLWVLTPTR